MRKIGLPLASDMFHASVLESSPNNYSDGVQLSRSCAIYAK